MRTIMMDEAFKKQVETAINRGRHFSNNIFTQSSHQTDNKTKTGESIWLNEALLKQALLSGGKALLLIFGIQILVSATCNLIVDVEHAFKSGYQINNRTSSYSPMANYTGRQEYLDHNMYNRPEICNPESFRPTSSFTPAKQSNFQTPRHLDGTLIIVLMAIFLFWYMKTYSKRQFHFLGYGSAKSTLLIEEKRNTLEKGK